MAHPSPPPSTDPSNDSFSEDNAPSKDDAPHEEDSSSKNEALYSNTGRNPQSLSIQWLCVEKIIKILKLDNSRPINLSDAIEKLIDKYNTSDEGNKSAEKPNSNDDDIYKPQVEDGDEDVRKYAPYRLKKYVRINEVNTILNSRVAKKRTANVNPQHILFYYHDQPYPIIFAMTHDRAFLVVKDYVDHSFPTKVAAKIGNPKHLIYLERRPLFGEVKKTINFMDGKGEPECSSSLDLYHLIVTYECEIKCDSSLAGKLSKIEESPADSSEPADDESTSTDVAVPKKKSSKNRPVTIMVRTSGILRIKKRIDIKDYPKVLTLLANYMRGERTSNAEGKEEENDPLFAYLHHLYPVDLDCRKSLNKSLMKEIFRQYHENEEAEFCVMHKYVNDFLHADKFAYQIIPQMERFKHLSCRPPMLQDILAKIIQGEEKSNEKKFVKKFKSTKLKFSKVDEKKKGISEPLINYIEGELYIDKSCHLKIRNMWYRFTTDYSVHLHRNFKNMVKTAMMIDTDEDSKAHLSREWVSEREDVYNEGYLEPDQYGPDNGYLVFDKIFDAGKYTKMESVEFCDIFKFVASKDTVYLYHVKRKFNGQDVREVTSQLLNAAKLLRASISLEQPESYLQRLWAYIVKQPDENKADGKAAIQIDKAKADAIRREKAKKDAIRQYFNDSEAKFLEMFGTKKIVFVYAYQPDQERTLSSYVRNYFRVTPDTFTPGFGSEERKLLFQMLVERKYLDISGELTGKFYKFTSRADFTLEGEFSERSGEIFDYLKPYKPLSASTVAVLDLVRVAKQIKDLNFGFKISEIPCPPGGLPKKEKKKKEETESSEINKSSLKKGRKRKSQTSDVGETSVKKVRKRKVESSDAKKKCPGKGRKKNPQPSTDTDEKPSTSKQ